MLNFESDYIEGAHPKILKALIKTNMEQLSGYGDDVYSKSAKAKISNACMLPKAKITFVTGGTQANQLVISSILKPFEGVIACKTGHVSIHEAGAIEYTGHKVLEIPGSKGKISSSVLDKFLSDYLSDGNIEHMVIPGMVYITFPTEYGTLYSKQELTDIYSVCKKYNLPLYIDGARLGYGLASKECDITLPELAHLCDVFYIGGTKVGAICGEAIIFTHENEPAHFMNLTKKHGALMAKGRLCGIQFDTLFTDNLYFTISERAVKLSQYLKSAFVKKGYKIFLDSPTNQQFIVLENEKLKQLSQSVKFSFWEKLDGNHTVVRFATSWATKKENIDKLISLL